MSTIGRIFVFFIGLMISSGATAEIEVHEFSDPETKARFIRLSDELRCPKCQNTNLSGSNAPIAKDLRTQLIRLLREGKTDQQIQQYMVDRYGDFVLYRPQFKKSTWLLWFGPLIVLLLGLFVITRILAGRRSNAQYTDKHSEKESSQNDGSSNLSSLSSLSPTEQERLRRLIKTNQDAEGEKS